ncbi:ArsR/SmtB family transcription factor [Oenococcus kitaharae]|uniref:ArsR/SmtB family transcription factor n=1 Tax=Oenococcus TaxID=46254 RepID=UPI0021E98D4B|nr:metalloregulator ArsR/SmtB family transcription factor [Oenococcus kitaharae]MCV3296467.1 metalloregulator ArsR/SmtB family transcription factor [Oenococcus kitaharae]
MSESLKLIHQAKLDEAAKIAKVLASPTRIQILNLLEQDRLNVGELVSALGSEQSTVSHQLQKLRAYQLISQERIGKSVYYELDDPHIVDTLNQLLGHVDHLLLGEDHAGKHVSDCFDINKD